MPSITMAARLVLSASTAFFLAFPFPLDAITISVVGDWAVTLDAVDLAGGAGSDFASVQESDADQGAISIGGTGAAWRVDVRKSDAVWNGDLQLSVRRTSDGSGTGSISGGTTYLELSALDTTLFTGAEDREGIDVQTKLSGAAASLGAASFSTTITYTLVDE